MTEKDIEKMLSEDDGLDMSHVKKEDILAKAKQELYFGTDAATAQSEQSNKKKEKKSFFSFFTSKRFIPIVASLACAFTLFAGAIGLYNENYQTVYIDVNPSVALKLNRFDRVIGVELLNDDAKNLFSDTDLVGYDVEEALEVVISTCDSEGYVKEDSEIYLSATSKEEKKSEKLLSKLKTCAETMKSKDEKSYMVNTYNTKEEEMEKFKDSNISPAKDKIMHEIADADDKDDYDFEDLREKSMYELTHLKKKIQNHKHENFDDGFDYDDDRDDEDDRNEYDDKDDPDDDDDPDDEDDPDDDDDRNGDDDDEFGKNDKNNQHTNGRPNGEINANKEENKNDEIENENIPNLGEDDFNNDKLHDNRNEPNERPSFDNQEEDIEDEDENDDGDDDNDDDENNDGELLENQEALNGSLKNPGQQNGKNPR